MSVKVSIIIPVYNVEAYVADCIHSLLNQTLQEIEIIAVDDKGTDQSIDIIRNLQLSHPRGNIIKIVEMPQNSRAGMARNAGIDVAQGEFLGFVDSDDWVEPDMFEELYNTAKKENSEVCFSNATKEYADGKTSVLTHYKVTPGELTAEKKREIIVKYIPAFWTAIYKRSWWNENDMRFPKEKYEDSFIAPLVLVYAHKCSYVKRCFYHYMVRENSICTTADDTKYKYKILIFNKLINTLASKNLYTKFKNEIDFIYIKKAYLVAILTYVIDSEQPKTETIVSIRNEICKTIPHYQKNKYYKTNFYIRIIDLLFIHFPYMAIKLCKFYAKRKRISF
jgi:glycosyltransferase involved in cell wall biosynthesis